VDLIEVVDHKQVVLKMMCMRVSKRH